MSWSAWRRILDSALLKSLGHIQSVVERRNTIPILANVLIEAEGSDVTFRATDLDIEAIIDAARKRAEQNPRDEAAVLDLAQVLADGGITEVEVVGVCNRSEASSQAVCDAFGLRTVYPSVEALLADDARREVFADRIEMLGVHGYFFAFRGGLGSSGRSALPPAC